MAEIPDIAYLEAQLKKRWKRRIPLFLLYLVLIWYVYHISWIYIPLFTIMYLLLDELIKEGYLFKKEDLFKGITHEFIIIIVIMITIVKIAITKIRREKR